MAFDVIAVFFGDICTFIVKPDKQCPVYIENFMSSSMHPSAVCTLQERIRNVVILLRVGTTPVAGGFPLHWTICWLAVV